MDAKIQAMFQRLTFARDMKIKINHVFIDYVILHQILNDQCNANSWRRITHSLTSLINLIENNPCLRVEIIYQDWNLAADKLVIQGSHTHSLSLFFRGMDLPKWLMKSLHQISYSM